MTHEQRGARGTCADCSAPFRFDQDFYAGKGIKAPTRCRRCRDARRAARIELGGNITTVARTGTVAFVATPDCQEFVFQLSDVRSGGLPLGLGDRVVFESDPGREPPPGKLPFAFRVRRA